MEKSESYVSKSGRIFNLKYFEYNEIDLGSLEKKDFLTLTDWVIAHNEKNYMAYRLGIKKIKIEDEPTKVVFYFVMPLIKKGENVPEKLPEDLEGLLNQVLIGIQEKLPNSRCVRMKPTDYMVEELEKILNVSKKQ